MGSARSARHSSEPIHKPSKDPVERYDPEEILEKLDFAVVTARETLDRAALPGEFLN